MKLTIFHFGDSHWICNYGSHPNKEEKEFYYDYIEDFKDITFEQHFGGCEGDETVVVHTGDFANFYIDEFRSQPVATQFDDIKKRHLPLFRTTFPRALHFIAVPGNHDANKSDGGALPRDMFKDFISALEGWATPFDDPPVVRVPIPKTKKEIGIFLFNSAQEIYSPHPGATPVPYATVPRQSRSKTNDNDYFRIAVLHHNVLPQHGQRNRTISEDVFVDNGDFNAYLSKCNFKLVLSGHQHLDNDVCFSIEQPVPSSNRVRPSFENSVLSLSTPSFLRPELATQPGFNVIEITVSADNNLAELLITRYRYLRERGRFEARPPTKHILMISRIEDVKSPKEQLRRLNIADVFFNKIYNPEYNVGQLEQVLIRPSDNEHFQRMQKSIETCHKLAPNNIFAMYSAAILPPHTWMKHERTFHRLFLTNATRAFKRVSSGGDSEASLFNFKFTQPLYAALVQSLHNAKQADITGLVGKQENADKEFDGFWSPSGFQNANSLSMWQGEVVPSLTSPNVSSARPLEVFRNRSINVQFECKPCDIPHTFQDLDAERYPEEPFEVARIVIWPPEYFKHEDAFQFIQFHEEHFVPLFWLDPARLKTRNDDLRRRYGYALLYARKFKDPRTNEKALLQSTPLVFLNNDSGDEVTFSDTAQFARVGSLSSLDVMLWGLNGSPEYYRRRNAFLSAEFAALLRRPDIMFAIDAFAMIRTGNLDFLRNELSKLDNKCKEWLAATPIEPTFNFDI